MRPTSIPTHANEAHITAHASISLTLKANAVKSAANSLEQMCVELRNSS